MHEKITIDQVEKITGVSKRNIRFYEKEGLLSPERNSSNGYRMYDETDIWRIKVIKMLRMLDMPLEEINKILKTDKSLSEAIESQQKVLEKKAGELQSAIRFCEHIKKEELESLDVDKCLNHMEKTGGKGFFDLWVEDYKKVKKANRDMDFTFIPDISITNEREFTDALFQYAKQENLDLVITKESMYPEFTIDGVEYIAERNYSFVNGIPVAVVNCQRKDREIKGESVEEPRKKIQWFIHNWGGAIGLLCVYILITLPSIISEGLTWEGVLIFFSLLVVYGAMVYREKLLHFNDKTKK